VLEDAVAMQQRALSSFRSSRAAAGAWGDDQRVRADRTVLDPLDNAGQKLLGTLQRCAAACTEARADLLT